MAREVPARYASAQELSEDLRRFQTGRLVSAHAYSSRQLVARFLRRNALPVALTAAFVLALGALGGVSVRRVLAERAAAEAARDQARREAALSTRVSGFLTEMFQVSKPEQARGRAVPARCTARRHARKSAGCRATPTATGGRIFVESSPNSAVFRRAGLRQ